MRWVNGLIRRRLVGTGLTGPVEILEATRDGISDSCRIHVCADPRACNVEPSWLRPVEPPSWHGSVVKLLLAGESVDLRAFAPAGEDVADAPRPPPLPPPPGPPPPPPLPPHCPTNSLVGAALRVLDRPFAHVSFLAFLIFGHVCGFRPFLHLSGSTCIDLVTSFLPSLAATWACKPAHFYATSIARDARTTFTELLMDWDGPGAARRLASGHYGPLLPTPSRPRGLSHAPCGGLFCGFGHGWPCMSRVIEEMAPAGFRPLPASADGLCAFYAMLAFLGESGEAAARNLRKQLRAALAEKEGDPAWEAAAQLAGEAWNDGEQEVPRLGVSAESQALAPAGADFPSNGGEEGDAASQSSNDLPPFMISSDSEQEEEAGGPDLEEEGEEEEEKALRNLGAFLGVRGSSPQEQRMLQRLSEGANAIDLAAAMTAGAELRDRRDAETRAAAAESQGEAPRRQRKHNNPARAVLLKEGRTFLDWAEPNGFKTPRACEGDSCFGGTKFLRESLRRQPTRSERLRLCRAVRVTCEEDAGPDLPVPKRARRTSKGKAGPRHAAPALRLELLWWFCQVRGLLSRISVDTLMAKASALRERFASAAIAAATAVHKLPVITYKWLLGWRREYRISLKKPNKRWKVSREVLVSRLKILWLNIHRVRRWIQLTFGYDPEIWSFDQKPFYRNHAGSKRMPTLCFRGQADVLVREIHSDTRDRFSANTLVVTSLECLPWPFPPLEICMGGRRMAPRSRHLKL